jgi:hypothetical protein
MSWEIDSREFDRAIQFVFDHSHKLIPDIMNRGALVAIIGGRGVTGAMKRTKKANASAIKAVPVQAIAARVAQKARMLGKKLTPAEFRAAISTEYRRRVAAIGYTANVGWNNAAVAFGGWGIGKRAESKVGYASDGYGKRATASLLVAEMVNTAPAADLIGREALQDALNDTARDMIEHATQEMQGIYNQA